MAATPIALRIVARVRSRMAVPTETFHRASALPRGTSTRLPLLRAERQSPPTATRVRLRCQAFAFAFSGPRCRIQRQSQRTKSLGPALWRVSWSHGVCEIDRAFRVDPMSLFRLFRICAQLPPVRDDRSRRRSYLLFETHGPHLKKIDGLGSQGIENRLRRALLAPIGVETLNSYHGLPRIEVEPSHPRAKTGVVGGSVSVTSPGGSVGLTPRRVGCEQRRSLYLRSASGDGAQRTRTQRA